MRRAVAVAVIAVLSAGAFVAVPASAKKKAKPVPVTLFAHGIAPVGEADIPDAVNGSFMKMDTQEPGSGAPKSMGVTNFGVTPNPRCAGNPFFPVW